MPTDHDKLVRQVLKLFRQALADGRVDVADHLFCALEALDPGFGGPAIHDACRAIVQKVEERPPLHAHRRKTPGAGRREPTDLSCVALNP